MPQPYMHHLHYLRWVRLRSGFCAHFEDTDSCTKAATHRDLKSPHLLPRTTRRAWCTSSAARAQIGALGLSRDQDIDMSSST